MPAGNITAVERVRRLNSIKELLDKETAPDEIAKELGMTRRAVDRNIKYLSELNVSDLTTDQIAEKRRELYVELLEAAAEAKELFDKYKEVDRPVDAKRFFAAWMDTILMRQKLYGLDSIKMDNLTQVNVNQYIQPVDKIDYNIADRISKMLKESHEKKVECLS